MLTQGETGVTVVAHKFSIIFDPIPIRGRGNRLPKYRMGHTQVILVVTPHKGLKLLKRFTNLPSGSMSSILN